MIESILEIVFFLVLILLGVLTRLGKASFLIAGFNTLSTDEKKKVDTKKMCKLASNAIFLGALFVLTIIGASHFSWSGFVVGCAFVILIIYIVAITIRLNHN